MDKLPVKHCQNGRADICLAGAADGICCAEHECDIDTGIRENPKSALVDRMIVCAANRNKAGTIAIGIRHFCPIMRQNMMTLGGNWNTSEQGFIDQQGIFLTRSEALVVAKAAGQIKRRCGGDEKELFSENIY